MEQFNSETFLATFDFNLLLGYSLSNFIKVEQASFFLSIKTNDSDN